MPKVSVIIPVYNTERYLKKCLNSITCQTLSDIEIICINDASEDNSLKVLKEYEAKDNRIKTIDLKENKGAGYCRNLGIDTAQGEYIGFVDSDDFVDLDFYEKLYKKAIQTNADAVKGELWEINDCSPTPVIRKEFDLNNLIQKDKCYFYYTFTSAIYKRSFVLENNIDFPSGLCHMEDNFFTIKALSCYKTLEIVNNAKYYYDLTLNTRDKKQDITDTIESIERATSLIIDLINNLNINKNQYQILFSFILKQILEYCTAYRTSDFYDILMSTIDLMNKKCKYKEEILSSYLKYEKDLEINYLLNKEMRARKLKENECYFNQPNYISNYYEMYSKFLTDTKIKILVNHDAPLKLSKSEILTPIQLGKAIEQKVKNNKDNLQWLDANCMGDDDFEGNLSCEYNKIGLLTGAYWAYKNYDKIGNPDYIGIFDKRHFLDPKFLLRLEESDLILRDKIYLETNVETDLIKKINNEDCKFTMEAIEPLASCNGSLYKKFKYSNTIYPIFNFVMKKDMFFDFCEWIFPITTNFLSELKQTPCVLNQYNNLETFFELLINYYFYIKINTAGIKYYEFNSTYLNFDPLQYLKTNIKLKSGEI